MPKNIKLQLSSIATFLIKNLIFQLKTKTYHL